MQIVVCKPIILLGSFGSLYDDCHNPNLGLATKARACKCAGQKGSLRVTFHAPESAKECEGMNLHTPKGAPTLGIEVSWTLKSS
jgi:hypothetical protein